MRRRQPGLDLLRAMAIVFVVVYHAGLFGFALPFRIQRFGWIGVDLFFVLSGYLIGGQLLSALARGKSPDISRFYWRRALRILPAYLVIVTVYFFLPVLREFPEMPPLWKFMTFTQNLGLRGGTAFSHAWSLCIEGQFYLLLPFLIVALTRLRRSQVFFPMVIVLAGMAIRGLLAHTNLSMLEPSWGWWQQWIYYPTYARLDPLVIGVSLAAVECFRPKWWAALMRHAKWIWLPGLAAIVMALVLAEDGLGLVSCAFGFPLIAIGFGTFLISAVSPEMALSRVAIPGAAFFATVAYSIYLSHKLVIHWIEGTCAAHAIPLTSVSALLILFTAITLLGAILFFAVERPFLQLRQRQIGTKADPMR